MTFEEAAKKVLGEIGEPASVIVKAQEGFHINSRADENDTGENIEGYHVWFVIDRTGRDYGMVSKIGLHDAVDKAIAKIRRINAQPPAVETLQASANGTHVAVKHG